MKKQPVDAKKAAANDKENGNGKKASKRRKVHDRQHRHSEASIPVGILRFHPQERNGGRGDAHRRIRWSPDRGHKIDAAPSPPIHPLRHTTDGSRRRSEQDSVFSRLDRGDSGCSGSIQGIRRRPDGLPRPPPRWQLGRRGRARHRENELIL